MVYLRTKPFEQYLGIDIGVTYYLNGSTRNAADARRDQIASSKKDINISPLPLVASSAAVQLISTPFTLA